MKKYTLEISQKNGINKLWTLVERKNKPCKLFDLIIVKSTANEAVIYQYINQHKIKDYDTKILTF